ILTMHMGPDFILLNVSVEFEDDHTADDIENAIATMDREIKLRYPEVKRIFIEAEAADRALV
ncbi:MAG: cation transporter, partial [Gammaproteobacteria bacterium]|nr:cation transporter [Gammaproteobacteria bacterium]